jgi:hypothetical protein
MPQLERWDHLPEGVRQHLIDRMRDRAISVSDVNLLRLWVETRQVPEVAGTRISALSKSAAADRTPKRSCSEGKPRKVMPSDQGDGWQVSGHVIWWIRLQAAENKTRSDH